MAKTTEISIEEKLRQLFSLQKIDTKIDEIEVLKGELPIEVSDLEDEITGLETRLKNLNDTVKDIEKEGMKFTTKISEGEALIKKYTKQLDDVKNTYNRCKNRGAGSKPRSNHNDTDKIKHHDIIHAEFIDQQ